MKSIDARIAVLEQSFGATCEPPDIVLRFVRAPNRFVCRYQRTRTGQSISQNDGEFVADFVVRAQAARVYWR